MHRIFLIVWRKSKKYCLYEEQEKNPQHIVQNEQFQMSNLTSLLLRVNKPQGIFKQ